MGGIICCKKSNNSIEQQTESARQQSNDMSLPKQRQEQQLEWPLPKIEQYKDFVPNDRIDKKLYSLVESRFEKVISYYHQ